ncbi:hypothetical protein V7x_06260 [Crateriforma conspicua]|uniref:Uncharacterized protein n=1 Tax=Crateriforma conspicua TaxID=2527996 RepID=A0A5C6FPN9_9PLAN|nr:hypothetical protein V7x_06260 [Crateriforma conspicua]
MTSSGILVMLLSLGFVLTLISYCLFRVLTLPSDDADTP